MHVVGGAHRRITFIGRLVDLPRAVGSGARSAHDTVHSASAPLLAADAGRAPSFLLVGQVQRAAWAGVAEECKLKVDGPNFDLFGASAEQRPLQIRCAGQVHTLSDRDVAHQLNAHTTLCQG